MNPISKVPGVITRPARTAGAVAGATLGVGLRTTARVLGWAVERVVPSPEQSSPPMPEAPTAEAPAETAPAPADLAPAAAAPAKKTTAKKATSKTSTAKKAPARRAPSKKAAVVAPALGLTEAEVEADEPLLDPATAKAVASEAEVLQRAADPDKG